MMGVEFQVLKVLESLLIILLCKKFNYWVRCLKLSLIYIEPPPCTAKSFASLGFFFFFFCCCWQMAVLWCIVFPRSRWGRKLKNKKKKKWWGHYIYIYIMYSVTSPRRGDGNTPDKYSIYIKVASLPFFITSYLSEITRLCIYMSIYIHKTI